MNILLNQGKHPFYQKGETGDDYVKKLSSMKNENIKLRKTCSFMAKDLYSKLVIMEPHLRYSAANILKHPWITRQKFDKIPVLFLEDWKIRMDVQNMKKLIGLSIFLKYYKKFDSEREALSNSDNSIDFCRNDFIDKNYISRIIKISKLKTDQENEFKLRCLDSGIDIPFITYEDFHDSNCNSSNPNNTTQESDKDKKIDKSEFYKDLMQENPKLIIKNNSNSFFNTRGKSVIIDIKFDSLLEEEEL